MAPTYIQASYSYYWRFRDNHLESTQKLVTSPGLFWWLVAFTVYYHECVMKIIYLYNTCLVLVYNEKYDWYACLNKQFYDVE